MQHGFHAQKLLRLGFGEVGNGHAGGHRNHISDIFHADLVDDLLRLVFPLYLGLFALFTHLGLAVAYFGGTLKILIGNSGILFRAQRTKLVIKLLDLVGQYHIANAHARARFIDHVDGLIGQEAILDIAIGKRHCRLKRFIREVHMMMLFILIAQAFHDANGLLFIRLFDNERLESALERRILFQMLAVFVERGSADDLDLTARQRRLQDGSRIHRAFGCTRTDNGVELVDEQDDIVCLLDFLDALLQALLEFAAILRTGNERRNIQRDQTPIAQDIGYLISHDELRKPFDHRRFAHTRLTQEQRVVLLATAQDLHHALDLACAPDNRVELPIGRLLRKIDAEFLQHAIRRGCLRIELLAGEDRRLPHQIVERCTQVIS